MASPTTKSKGGTTSGKPAAKRTRSRVSRVKPAISVIVPIHNMESNVGRLYEQLSAGLKEFGRPYEVIFVDDASTDATWQHLDGLAQEDKHVKLVRMRSTFGESSAFDAALKMSKGETIVYAAARVMPDLREIGGLLSKLDEGHDLVMGWRWPRKDSSFNQKVSQLFNRLVLKFAKLDLHDINSSVFATKRSVLENITFYGNLNIFIPILAARKGYKVTETKISQLEGEFRQSKYVSEYIQRLLDIVTVIFLTNYSKKPLHFLGFFGMIFTLAGLGMNLYLFVYRFFGFGAIAGRPLLLLGALLLVIGLQMISIGLIGEMIIYTHAREIKEYNIETVVGE